MVGCLFSRALCVCARVLCLRLTLSLSGQAARSLGSALPLRAQSRPHGGSGRSSLPISLVVCLSVSSLPLGASIRCFSSMCSNGRALPCFGGAVIVRSLCSSLSPPLPARSFAVTRRVRGGSRNTRASTAPKSRPSADGARGTRPGETRTTAARNNGRNMTPTRVFWGGRRRVRSRSVAPARWRQTSATTTVASALRATVAARTTTQGRASTPRTLLPQVRCRKPRLPSGRAGTC
jgi:hypothetical protein